MTIEVLENKGRFSWDELVELLHEAFQERLEQGLQFTRSFIAAEELSQLLANSIILVAVDTDTDLLAGMAALRLYDDDNGKWAFLSDLAVRPQYKRRGIMTLLHKRIVEIAKSNNCEYIQSDTAVGAKSSVKWHLKNGYRKYDMCSFKATNYYSYIFRKQLVPHPIWSNPIKSKLYFWKKALKCRIYDLENGEDRQSKWLDFYLKLRGAK